MRTSDDDPYTYFHVGATQDAVLPAGYTHVRLGAVLGHGRRVFREGEPSS